MIGGVFTRDYCVQDADTITAPTKVMKIVYYASILAGELDSPEHSYDEDDAEANAAEKASQKAAAAFQVRER